MCYSSLQRVDRAIDTLAEFEKGRYIFRNRFRRRTMVLQRTISKKASNGAGFSMKPTPFMIRYIENKVSNKYFYDSFPACGRPTFSTV